MKKYLVAILVFCSLLNVEAQNTNIFIMTPAAVSNAIKNAFDPSAFNTNHTVPFPFTGTNQGGATNGIQNLNGNGTNTTLTNATLNGTLSGTAAAQFVQTNEIRVINATNTSNTFGSMFQKWVNTNIYVGSGTVSGAAGGHLVTNSGTGFANVHYGNYIIISTIHQFSICEIISSSVVRTFEPLDGTYSGASWLYYSNYVDMYDSVPNFMGAIDSGAGHWMKGQEFANAARYWFGSGTNVWSLHTQPNYGIVGDSGPHFVFTTYNNTVPFFISLFAPNNTLSVRSNGDIWIGTAVSNFTGNRINFKVPTQELNTKYLNTAVNVGAGTVSTLINTHLWTNSGTGFSGLEVGNFFITSSGIYTITEVVSSSILRTFQLAAATHAGSTWTYYSNYTSMYDASSLFAGGTDGAGGHHIAGGGSSKLWIGQSSNTWSIYVADLGGLGSALQFYAEKPTSLSTAGNPFNIWNSAPYESLDILPNGAVSIRSRLTNLINTNIIVDVPLAFNFKSPGLGKVPTGVDANGNWEWQSTAASAQTPWVTNIDSAGFNLKGAEITLNGLTHGITNAATEGWVSNNFPVIFTNYNLFNFTTNIVAIPLFTNTSSSAMFEISCAFFIRVIPAATTNTLSFGWLDEASLSNSINVIDHVVRSTVGSITTAPFTMSVSPSSIVTMSLTMDGSTAGYSNSLRVCVKKLQ